MSGSARMLSEIMDRAIAAFSQGRLSEAEQLCRVIIAANGQCVEAVHLLAVVQSSSGRIDDALASYDRVLTLRPNYAEALCDRGVTLHGAGRFEAALASYDRALALRPDHAAAHYNRAITLSALHRFEAAAVSYDRALALRPDYPEALSNRGNALRQLGRLDEALASYERALSLRPAFADALHNRGVVFYQQRRFEEALASYDRALALKPDLAETHYNRANALQALDRFEEALAGYDRALALRGDHADALYNRGNTLKELKQLDAALASYDRALALRDDHAETWANRGYILHQCDRFEEAVASYDRALAARPDFPDVLHNRGLSLFALKRFEDALANFDAALKLHPSHADALNSRGSALFKLDRFAEALSSYDQALETGERPPQSRSDTADALYNRGHALKALTRSAEALESFDRVLTLDPRHADALNSRGNALFELSRYEEALASYDAALAIRPDFAEACCNRGAALRELGHFEESRASYAQAIALKPDQAPARFGLCMAELPVFYADEDEIERRREAYEQRLRALRTMAELGSAELGSAEPGMAEPGTSYAGLAKGVGTSQPFFLAYQGRNDRELQALYGSFVCRIMAERYPPVVPAPPAAPGEQVRVGIVSGFFRHHSNWKLPVKGWLSQLDRRMFRISGFYTGFQQDAETAAAVALCDRFVQGPLSLDRWRAEILADSPHVLIYPEVGMDPIAVALAAQRLAAVQCNSWGHPDTSGFPTLDYYLSSDLMEPPDGQDHYTERLVRLPNLSVYCEPAAPPSVPIARHDLGLRSAATAYWCGQSLYKYLPQFDDVFPRIASALGDCQFVFIHHQNSGHVTDLFRQRIGRAFAARGLNADGHCLFLPRLTPQEFVAAAGQCDIVLDSIGWSGCNSTLESLPHDLPIVTQAGALMRGRHTMAILKRMEVTETIAETVDGYVSIAVRLARDLPWRAAVKARIAAGKQRIYRDKACISGLERFLDRVGRGLPGT